MLQGVKLSQTQSPTTVEDREKICQAGRYQSNPGVDHWTALKNILKCLKRTKDMFLVYGGDKELVVNGYVDASFDTDLDDSKSQTRYMFILNGGAVSWCSSK